MNTFAPSSCTACLQLNGRRRPVWQKAPWDRAPMCVVCQEGKMPAFFGHQSGLKTKNCASSPGSGLRSETEHPPGLTLRAAGSSSIPGSLRLSRCTQMPLMPGARSKRCRQARPLTGVGRLTERERPACGRAHQCRTRSLSARSAHPPRSRAASPAPLARRNAGVTGSLLHGWWSRAMPPERAS